MGYCFNLYTPDMKEQDSGKFVACEKLLFSNDVPFVINTNIMNSILVVNIWIFITVYVF